MGTSEQTPRLRLRLAMLMALLAYTKWTFMVVYLAYEMLFTVANLVYDSRGHNATPTRHSGASTTYCLLLLITQNSAHISSWCQICNVTCITLLPVIMPLVFHRSEISRGDADRTTCSRADTWLGTVPLKRTIDFVFFSRYQIQI